MNLDKLRQFGNIIFVIKVILQFNLILWYIIFQFVVELQTAMRVFTDNGTTPIYYNHSQMSLGEKNKLHHRCTNSINILIA